MNTRKHLIIVKGEIKTAEIRSCRYNGAKQRMEVEYNGGSMYPYICSNVEWLQNPQTLNPHMYRISKGGREFHDIEAIYIFRGSYEIYWHICFENGSEKDYLQRELNIVKTCLDEKQARNVFEYIKQIASLSDLKNEESGEKLLAKRFEKISFVGNDVALAKYLNPSLMRSNNGRAQYTPIFPFGCNNSQYKAVKNAMENQISVIQGPPGTGKTQTILNIIANILLQGKTVQIVSNNNSATENVYEKLASSKYNLGFIEAMLGNSENKRFFIENQNENYPNLSAWKLNGNPNNIRQNIYQQSLLLKKVFDAQEDLARLRQEQAALEIEYQYFKQYVEETNISTESRITKRKLTSKQWMMFLNEHQMNLEMRKKIDLWIKIKGFLQYGISDLNFYKQDIGKIITIFQENYYNTRMKELRGQSAGIENWLNGVSKNLLNDFCNQSMWVLRDNLARKFEGRKNRTIFTQEDLWKNPYKVLEEYPVILGTTFSSTSSLNSDVIYDYLIMDESSQVDVATGALALSCARNVIIVGDTQQLPNVVTDTVRGKAKAIFDSFHVHPGYQFTKGFLQSVLEVMPNVTQTLLREHYRCHPKIINFCNQKFYRGELLVMTEDMGEEDVLAVVKTVPGNHARDHYSQRQIDVIKNEIIPKYVISAEETGIIAPYKNQVAALGREIKGIDVATVHKFQGKEKDTIIISTVDDEISDFVDDPYLINVAVSRARKKLLLVVSGNEQVKDRNITDLIDYIQYHNFEVRDSKIYSVFDYLYKQYMEERKEYLEKHKKISQYDSENLMHALIRDILSEDRFACLDVVSHFSLSMLIKDLKLLSEQECQYAMNPATHIDFLLYNRISKKPVLAIEVDGYEYHKDGTIQASRDLMKNHILELYGIPLLRFKTNGSGERGRIVEKLEEVG